MSGRKSARHRSGRIIPPAAAIRSIAYRPGAEAFAHGGKRLHVLGIVPVTKRHLQRVADYRIRGVLAKARHRPPHTKWVEGHTAPLGLRYDQQRGRPLDQENLAL